MNLAALNVTPDEPSNSPFQHRGVPLCEERSA
jgi:hypothetical protein